MFLLKLVKQLTEMTLYVLLIKLLGRRANYERIKLKIDDEKVDESFEAASIRVKFKNWEVY